MRRIIILAAMVSTGCSDRNPEVCSSDMPARVAYIVPRSAIQVQANVKGCVSHWAARLSMGPDSAETAARASLAACRDGFTDLAMQASIDGKAVDITAFKDEMYDISLFRVVQTRAGNCGIPGVGELPPLEKSEQHFQKEHEATQLLEKSKESRLRSVPVPVDDLLSN